MPTRWGDASTQAWTIQPGNDLVAAVHRSVATDRTPVYLVRKVGTGPFVFDPLVAGALVREGIPFYVGDALRIHQYGLETGLGSYTPPRRLLLTSDIHATDLGTRIYTFDGLGRDLGHRFVKVRRRLRRGPTARFTHRPGRARPDRAVRRTCTSEDAATLRRVVGLVERHPRTPGWYLLSDDMAWGLTRTDTSQGEARPLIQVVGADEDAVRGWATLRITQLDRRFALYLGPNPG